MHFKRLGSRSKIKRRKDLGDKDASQISGRWEHGFWMGHKAEQVSLQNRRYSLSCSGKQAWPTSPSVAPGPGSHAHRAACRPLEDLPREDLTPGSTVQQPEDTTAACLARGLWLRTCCCSALGTRHLYHQAGHTLLFYILKTSNTGSKTHKRETPNVYAKLVVTSPGRHVNQPRAIQLKPYKGEWFSNLQGCQNHPERP